MRFPAIGLAVLAIGAGLASTPARAQMDSREAIGLQNEILELRQQMSQLQQFQTQATGGGQSALPPPMPEGGAPVSGGAGDAVAQLVVRVANLEEEMRTLGGRVSELENAEHRDHDELAKQIGDLAFKLGQGGAAPSVSAPGAPGGGGELTPPQNGDGQSGMDLGYTPPPAAPHAAPSVPAHRSAELALKQGSAALARRDYAGAEAAAREVLALGHGPRLVDANFLLARAQAGDHQYQDAAANYYGVYKANPRSPRAAEALLGVSNALIGLGSNAPACQALAKLGAEFPKPEAYVRAGVASARNGLRATSFAVRVKDELAVQFERFMESAGASHRPCVAVSGGADSLCLALLACGWGDALALIVDHGIRADSASEAALTAARLTGLGIASRVLTLAHLAAGPGLAARARAARYGALFAAVRDAGRVDLLVGHHRRDQAETVLMRRLSGSGAAGLAGMAPIVETRDVRVLRPLLDVAPGALRDMLRTAGIEWVEDPSNTDLSSQRARLRADLHDPLGDGPQVSELAAGASAHGQTRAAQDALVAAELAARVAFFPEGYAVMSPGPISPQALGAVIRALTGAGFVPPAESLERLASCPATGVLGGMRLTPAGKLGGGILCVREAASLAPPVPARAGTLWDRRFLLTRGWRR